MSVNGDKWARMKMYTKWETGKQFHWVRVAATKQAKKKWVWTVIQKANIKKIFRQLYVHQCIASDSNIILLSHAVTHTPIFGTKPNNILRYVWMFPLFSRSLIFLLNSYYRSLLVWKLSVSSFSMWFITHFINENIYIVRLLNRTHTAGLRIERIENSNSTRCKILIFKSSLTMSMNLFVMTSGVYMFVRKRIEMFFDIVPHFC